MLGTGQGRLAGLANAVGDALLVSVALGSVWELFAKRAFTLEIFETFRTNTDIDASGLVRIGTNYVSEPDWGLYFAAAKHIDVVFAYGRTWFNNNVNELRTIAQQPDARIRVFLPDPSDEHGIQATATKMSVSPDELRGRISETLREFMQLRKRGGANIEIYYRPAYCLFSFYRFGDIFVVTFYTHSRQRQPNVPTLVCKSGGVLYKFFDEELKALHGLATAVDPPIKADG